MTEKKSDWQPIAALLLGATLWGTMWWPLRHFETAGLSGGWMLFASYGLAALVALPWMWRSRRDWRQAPGVLLLLVIFGGWTNVAFSFAVLEGQVVRVLLLFYLAPVWSILGGRIFLGERLSAYRLLAMLIALTGALLVLVHGDPRKLAETPLIRADWLALSAGIAFAATNITLRFSPGMSNANRAGAVWIGVALFALIAVLLESGGTPSVSGVLFLQIALFTLGWLMLATLLIQFGVVHMEVGRSSVIMLFEIIVGAVSAALLAGETIALLEWVGALFIVRAAWLEARDTDQGHPATQP